MSGTMKVDKSTAARMRARANAKAVRKEAIARRRAGKKPKSKIVPLLVVAAGLAVVAFFVQPDPPPQLPPELKPTDFASCLEASRTARIGTMIQVTMTEPPMRDDDDNDFRMRVRAAASIAKDAGYDSIRVTDPAGTTVASGPVEDMRFHEPPPASGT